jgi:hypothetical protein
MEKLYSSADFADYKDLGRNAKPLNLEKAVDSHKVTKNTTKSRRF